MTYDGFENCVHDNCAFENESSSTLAEFCSADSLEEDASSASSSKDGSASLSFPWLPSKDEAKQSREYEPVNSRRVCMTEKPSYTMQLEDINAMKERFSKLLLGEDMSGGCKGLSTALALSNAITNLAGSLCLLFSYIAVSFSDLSSIKSSCRIWYLGFQILHLNAGN